MKKYFSLIIALMLQFSNLIAQEYNSVEDILSDNSFNIDKLGYPGNKDGCQEFINNWVEKLTIYINKNPDDARGYFYRGYIFKFKALCWKNTDSTIQSLDRETFLSSQFFKNNIEQINADWNASLAANEKSTDKLKPLSWWMLSNNMNYIFLDPLIYEKKEKLRIEIATTVNLGAGTEHPMDKSTFVLQQYEKIADNYNYVDDRKNATRILNELAQISPEGRVKANKLTPMYEKAWQQRDNKITLQQESATKDTMQATKPAQPKSKIPEFQSRPVQISKPAIPKIEPEAEKVDRRVWYFVLGILVIIVIGVAFLRRRSKK